MFQGASKFEKSLAPLILLACNSAQQIIDLQVHATIIKPTCNKNYTTGLNIRNVLNKLITGNFSTLAV